VPPADEPKRDTTRDTTSNSALAGEIVARPAGPLPQPPLLPPHGSQPPPSTAEKAQPIEMPRSADEITQPGVAQPTPVPGSLTLRGIPTAEPKPDKEPAKPEPKARASAPSIPPPIPSAALRNTPAPQIVTPSPAVVSTLSGMGHASSSSPSLPKATPVPSPAVEEPRGSIMGIGMTAIGATSTAGEIPTKVPPGSRVLVPGPNGLMQSATVRQLLQGYYELEVGSSGETIWVPISGVVPE
jgi:hypothetical protein